MAFILTSNTLLFHFGYYLAAIISFTSIKAQDFHRNTKLKLQDESDLRQIKWEHHWEKDWWAKVAFLVESWQNIFRLWAPWPCCQLLDRINGNDVNSFEDISKLWNMTIIFTCAVLCHTWCPLLETPFHLSHNLSIHRSYKNNQQISWREVCDIFTGYSLSKGIGYK